MRGVIVATLLLAAACSSRVTGVIDHPADSTPDDAPGADPNDDGADADVADNGTDEGHASANPIFDDLLPGHARSLGRYTCVDIPGDWYAGCGTVTDYSGMVYDSGHQQILMYGGGHAATIQTDMRAFDLTAESPAWTSQTESTPYASMVLANLDLERAKWLSTGHPVQRHTYDNMELIPELHKLVVWSSHDVVLYTQGYPADFPGATTSSDVFEYDTVAKSWSSYPDPVPRPSYGALSYDAAGRVLVYIARVGVWTYNVDTHAVTQVLSFDTSPATSYGQNVVYHPGTDRHYYMRADGVVFALRYDRQNPTASTFELVETTGALPTVPDAANIGSNPDASETGWALDDRRDRICGSLQDHTMACFSPVSRALVLEGLTADDTEAGYQHIVFHHIVYDPVNDVFVLITPGIEPYTKYTAAWRPL